MKENTDLSIFYEPQPISTIALTEEGKIVQVFGVAQFVNLPYLEARFSKLVIGEMKTFKPGNKINIYLEVHNNILTVYTIMIEERDINVLILRVEHLDQKKQKEIAQRITVNDVSVDYCLVDEMRKPVWAIKSHSEVINISKSGILIQMAEVVTPNSLLELNIHFYQNTTHTCYARVTRLVLQKNSKIGVALRFEKQDGLESMSLDSINHYVNDQCLSQ